MSDGEILGTGARGNASLRLTAWLTSRYGIRLRNVIGHNESLTSPYHTKLHAPLEVPDAQNSSRADMDIYRAASRRSPGPTVSPSVRPRARGTPHC